MPKGRGCTSLSPSEHQLGAGRGIAEPLDGYCPLVGLSPALSNCGFLFSSVQLSHCPQLCHLWDHSQFYQYGIFPSSSQLWDFPQFYPTVGLFPVLLSEGIVPSSAQLWHCPQFCPVVGLSPALPKCGIVSSSALLWVCLQLCSTMELPRALPLVGLSPVEIVPCSAQ